MKKYNNRFVIKLIKRLGVITIISEVISFIFLVIGVSLLKDVYIMVKIVGLLFILTFLLQNFLFVCFFVKVFNHLRLEEEHLRKCNKEIHKIISKY